MYEPLDDNLVGRLRDGLRTQPEPSISEDFDERVLAALVRPEPWWRTLVASMRSAVPSAAGSLVLTLLAANWMVQPTADIPRPRQHVVESAPLDIEALLLHSDLSGATLLSLHREIPRSKPEPASDGDVPRRRSDVPVFLA